MPNAAFPPPNSSFRCKSKQKQKKTEETCKHGKGSLCENCDFDHIF